MPTYEYECVECGDRFEVFQRMSDAPMEKCEKCGGALRKVFSPVGIVFKGSGFYVTDSRKNGSSSSKSSTSSLPKKTDTTDTASGASTPAAASDSSTTST